MKKISRHITVCVLLFIAMAGRAQQLPYFTQTNVNYYLLNPAVTGTKKVIDARMNYRMQWTGFDGAPRTQTAMLHSRLFKGLMGFGVYAYKDETGPLKHYNYGASYAFHLRFPDVELSIGASGNMMRYFLDGSEVTVHNTQDRAVDQDNETTDWLPNANGGIYLYNDRFHFGLSMLNILQESARLQGPDSTRQSKFTASPHTFLSLGYNFSVGTDYIWEHTLVAGSMKASPLLIDYTLRIHVYEKFFIGTGLRLKDAVTLQTGVTIKKMFQLGYSYDFVFSGLRKSQSGSHEVSLIYRTNLFDEGKKGNLSKFLKQKYDLF